MSCRGNRMIKGLNRVKVKGRITSSQRTLGKWSENGNLTNKQVSHFLFSSRSASAGGWRDLWSRLLSKTVAKTMDTPQTSTEPSRNPSPPTRGCTEILYSCSVHLNDTLQKKKTNAQYGQSEIVLSAVVFGSEAELEQRCLTTLKCKPDTLSTANPKLFCQPWCLGQKQNWNKDA